MFKSNHDPDGLFIRFVVCSFLPVGNALGIGVSCKECEMFGLPRR